jgi:L,D-transpeptidase catalytic domain
MLRFFYSIAGFVMLSHAVFAASLDITINKVSQKMTVRVDGDIEYVWPVSTGAPGYDTPSGKFRPFRMEAEHFSAEWDNAPMPNSIFFTGEGHAIHGSQYTKSLGRRASHGCVRLAPSNAAKLYALVQKNGMKNTSVAIKGGFFDFDYDGPGLIEGFKLASKKKTSVQAGKSKKKKRFLFAGNDG